MDKIKNIEFRTADDEITVQDRDRSSGTDEVPVQRVVVFVRLDGHLSVEKKTFQTWLAKILGETYWEPGGFAVRIVPPEAVFAR